MTKRSLGLENYDSRKYGPLLGISDEGSATGTIVQAAQASAKALAGISREASVAGIIVDGERMTSAGEAPIGPDEYANILPIARDQIFISTNIGVRVNTRLYQPLPEFAVADACNDEKKWLELIFQKFLPFVKTPDNVPRPLTVRLRLKPEEDLKQLRNLIPKLEQGRADQRLGPPELHRLSLLMKADDCVENHIPYVIALIELAADLGVSEVAVDGALIQSARRRLSTQGLLNVLEIDVARSLLKQAKQAGVRLAYDFEDDELSSSRTIWAGLDSARNAGLNAAKYGLVPLTLEKQQFVIENVQRWMSGWTAIPAFYVDTPLVSEYEIDASDDCVQAAKRWMQMAAQAGAKVALIDSPDRITPRRLLKKDSSDNVGVLTIDEVKALQEFADCLGLKVLWSGGIQPQQVFDVGKLGVFGIFTTSSAAHRTRVEGVLMSDHQLAESIEPTLQGIQRIHAILQAGYLCHALAAIEPNLAREIETRVQPLLTGNAETSQFQTALDALNRLLVQAWQKHWANQDHDLPVSPDSVRVWRGFRRSDLPEDRFFEKLATVFLPATVQIQSQVGLSAYLPSILPRQKPGGIPDEIALVFYRYQRAYDEAKTTVGGRAYSDMHELVFDLNKSTSGFPRRFEGVLELDERYYLFDRRIDWQRGHAKVFVGARAGNGSSVFRDAVAQWLRDVQSGGDRGPDGAIAICSWDYMVYWEHWPDAGASVNSDIPRLEKIADPVYQESISPYELNSGLWSAFQGVGRAVGRSFNFQFTR